MLPDPSHNLDLYDRKATNAQVNTSVTRQRSKAKKHQGSKKRFQVSQ